MAVIPTLISVFAMGQAPVTSTPQEQQFDNLVQIARTRVTKEKKSLRISKIAVSVDDRVELLSLIFRLAGNDEYNTSEFKGYCNYIDARFRPFVKHPAVQFARNMHEQRWIGATDVANLAVHIGHLPGLVPPQTFEGTTLWSSWRPADAKAFIPLVQDFAKETGFAEFYKRSVPIHELAETRMRKLLQKEIDADWFAAYFGERKDSKKRLAIGLFNGPVSYGFSARPGGGAEELFAILGTWQFDNEGLPTYQGDVTANVVHEFCHSFVDPAVMKHQPEFKAAYDVLQPDLIKAVPKMKQFYWVTMFQESLVRAIVVRYLQTHLGTASASAELAVQRKANFIWLESLASVLQEYERHRDRYPTFEAFLPRVADYFRGLPALLPGLVGKN